MYPTASRQGAVFLRRFLFFAPWRTTVNLHPLPALMTLTDRVRVQRKVTALVGSKDEDVYNAYIFKINSRWAVNALPVSRPWAATPTTPGLSRAETSATIASTTPKAKSLHRRHPQDPKGRGGAGGLWSGVLEAHSGRSEGVDGFGFPVLSFRLVIGCRVGSGFWVSGFQFPVLYWLLSIF